MSSDQSPTGGSLFSEKTISGRKTTIPLQDLSRDALIANAPRVKSDGLTVPALGGIPLLAKLGQGGMGAVYYGIHPRLDTEVAVKVLPFHLAEKNPDMIKRFFREAKIAAKVRSPHLVSVTDVNEEHGLVYLVMEFVLGESAGACLRKVRESGLTGMQEAVALEICIAAAQGLAAAHAQGIIHRDIKPDNIMIPKRAAPVGGDSILDFAAAKVADLGLARGEGLDSTLTGTHSAMGTPGYMPPEQIEDARHCGKSADVFSMGVTLYVLLAGRTPFTGDSFMKIARATIETPHGPIRSLRPDVSALTSQLIDDCLAKKPSDRFADGSALVTALKLCREKLGEPEQTLIKAAQELTQLRAVAEVGVAVPQATPEPAGALSPPPSTGNIPASGPQDGLHAPRKASRFVAMALLALVVGGGYFGWVKYLNGVPLVEKSTDLATKDQRELADIKARETTDKKVHDDAEKKARDEADKVSEENRVAARNALADLEALRGQVDKAENELRGAVASDPILAKVKTLCDENVFGGPKRLEAEKAFSRGKTDQLEKNYPEATKDFHASEKILQAALQFRNDAEGVLRVQARANGMVEKTLLQRSADEKPYYMAVEKLSNDTTASLSTGDVAKARKLLLVAKAALERVMHF